MISNATKHNFSRQEYIGELTGCSAYFPSSGKSNSARAMLHGCDVLLFKLSEAEGTVDAIITIPDDFSSIHYFRNQATTDGITKDAHLTYHGLPKRKKMTGEIHLVNDGQNRFSGQSNRVAAPLSVSSDIKTHPLPICRIELNLQARKVQPKNSISNFFELHPGNVFFNTIEIYLARSGFLHAIASCAPSVRNVLGSIFVFTDMQSFYADTLCRRAGLYPQALALQTKNYELVILATHEYKNPFYEENTLRYFHTEDYFKNLVSRSCAATEQGWFVGQKSHAAPKPGFSILKTFF